MLRTRREGGSFREAKTQNIENNPMQSRMWRQTRAEAAHRGELSALSRNPKSFIQMMQIQNASHATFPEILKEP